MKNKFIIVVTLTLATQLHCSEKPLARTASQAFGDDERPDAQAKRLCPIKYKQLETVVAGLRQRNTSLEEQLSKTQAALQKAQKQLEQQKKKKLTALETLKGQQIKKPGAIAAKAQELVSEDSLKKINGMDDTKRKKLVRDIFDKVRAGILELPKENQDLLKEANIKEQCQLCFQLFGAQQDLINHLGAGKGQYCLAYYNDLSEQMPPK